jgi:hypothetical protein
MRLRKFNITLLLLVIGLAAMSQTDKTGYNVHITTVFDDSIANLRGPCPDATVQIVCTKHNLNLTATTDTGGHVEFTALPRGRYALTCIKSGVDTFYTRFSVRYQFIRFFIFKKKRLHLGYYSKWHLSRGAKMNGKVEEGYIRVTLDIYKKHGVKLVPYTGSNN